jgi:hypothetical protein
MLLYKKGNQFVDLDMKKYEDGILYSISTYLMKQ